MPKKSRRSTGSVITVKRLSGRGLGSLKNPSSGLGAVVPPVVGGALAGASTILIEHLASPATGEIPSDMMMTLGEYAPYVGVGVGALGSAALYAMIGAPQGAAAMAGAVGVVGALIAYKLMNQSKLEAGIEPPVTSTSGRRRAMRRVGAVVPQLQPAGMAGRRTGAIVMEPTSTNGLRGGLGDPRGETVNLGQVSPAAFGTPGFAL